MADELQDRLRISTAHLDEINALLLDPNSRVVQDFMRLTTSPYARRLLLIPHGENRLTQSL